MKTIIAGLTLLALSIGATHMIEIKVRPTWHQMEVECMNRLAIKMIEDHRMRQRFYIPRDTEKIVHGVDFRAVA